MLLAAHADPARTVDAATVAPTVRVEESIAARVLSELAGAHLLQPAGTGFKLAESPEIRSAVAQLAVMYNTKPVTLIRAIYERPATPAQSFADAFRIRRPEE